MADALLTALDQVVPADAGEAEAVARVRSLAANADPWSRDQPLHVTGSALVLHPPTGRVLLRWHATLQAWLQVGGHGDAGERDPFTVALREAREETGLTDLAPLPGVPGPVHVVIVPVPHRPAAPGRPAEAAHQHADVRYLLTTAHPDAVRAETADTPLRWLSLCEAADEVTEANLLDTLGRARRALGG